jgi:hypothetical protein
LLPHFYADSIYFLSVLSIFHLEDSLQQARHSPDSQTSSKRIDALFLKKMHITAKNTCRHPPLHAFFLQVHGSVNDLYLSCLAEKAAFSALSFTELGEVRCTQPVVQSP